MLTPDQTNRLRTELAQIPAAVVIPTYAGTIYCCPRRPRIIHQCPSSFTVTQAEQFAAYIAETMRTEAHVLVYGVEWLPGRDGMSGAT